MYLSTKKKCKLTEDNIKIYLTQQISRFSLCEDYGIEKYKN
jgi:hypothetical protein